MPRRNRRRRPRTHAVSALLPPEPEPTARQLAQRLVSRGLAVPAILEMDEAYSPPRRTPDAPS